MQAWCWYEESNPGHPTYEIGVLSLNYTSLKIDKRRAYSAKHSPLGEGDRHNTPDKFSDYSLTM